MMTLADMRASMEENGLEHHGVKGMKWGVRQDKGHEGEQAKTKKIAKLDKKYERQNSSMKTYAKVYNAAAEKHDVILGLINNKAEYKNTDLSPNTTIGRKYHEEVRSTFERTLNETAQSLIGSSASGKIQLAFGVSAAGEFPSMYMSVPDQVEHAADDNRIELIVERESNGLILGIQFPQFNSLAQSDIKHYGTKGMKWGVRKDRPGGRSGLQSKAPEAVNAQALRARARAARSTDVLTNKELQEYVTRANLEQQYSRLTTPQKSIGAKFTQDLMAQVGKEKVKQVIVKNLSVKAVRTALAYGLGPFGVAVGGVVEATVK